MTVPATPTLGFGLKALLLLVAVIVFVLGVFGVHFGAISGPRFTDLGLVFFAAAFLVP